MILGAAYFLAAATLTSWIHEGGPGWLNLFVLLGIWNGLKFILFGPASVIFLARARISERRDEVRRIKTEPKGAGLLT